MTLADIFFTSFVETLLMVAGSCVAGALFGIPLGLALFASSRSANQSRFSLLLAHATHGLRATPSIMILVVAIAFTHFALGASNGLAAALIPLSIIATPFVARQTETALRHAQEQAPSAPLLTILALAKPGIIAGLGVTLACLVGYSALAGALGDSGLGKFAMQYGYSDFRPLILLAVVVVLIVLAETAQAVAYQIAQRLGAKPGSLKPRPYSATGRTR